MYIKVRRYKRGSLPPIGSYTTAEMFQGTFKDVEIKPVQVERLLPPGVRQSQAEARIMGRIVAIRQNRASLNGDINSCC